MNGAHEARSGPGAFRLALAAVLVLVALVVLAVQALVVYSPVTQGDAMGMGMDRAFRELIAWSLVPFQLGLVGMACGLVLSAPIAARLRVLCTLAAVVDWVGTAVVAGVLVAVGLSPGAAAIAGVTVLGVWVLGFFAVGMAAGASRGLGAFVVVVLPLVLAVLAPPLLYIAQS